MKKPLALIIMDGFGINGSDYGNVIVVNGGSVTTSDLAPHMNDDGVYTFRVQAAAAGTQSEWSDASATSYKRDTQKPTIKGEPSKRIDAKTAENWLREFLRHALDEGIGCVRIIHGKGRYSAEGVPVLKNLVDRMLRQRADVLAFHSAPAAQGGTGAVLVLLARKR